MNDILPILIQTVLALISVISLLLNRKESKSRIENLAALTKKAEAETDKNYQEQINNIIDENLSLFKQLQDERESNMQAQKRISKDIVNLQTDLRMTNQSLGAEQARSLKLDDELTRYRNAHMDDLLQIDQLKQQLASQNNKLQQHDVSLELIKRNTGQLPAELPDTLEHKK